MARFIQPKLRLPFGGLLGTRKRKLVQLRGTTYRTGGKSEPPLGITWLGQRAAKSKVARKRRVK